jgi:SHS2 domain-containing protein
VSVRFLDHTADVGAEITAASRDELFAEAAKALLETIVDPATVRPSLQRSFELSAPDLETLLVDWLSELVYVFDVDRQLFADAEVSVTEGEGGEQRLTAVARGEPYDPSRHPMRVLVKAVTHHALEVTCRPDGTWFARVIFDI